MFKIGEFSKLSRVSVKTLRYYDEVGLLRPGEVDRFTGYRYYSASQLPRLNRILALKDLGFSLEQIARLLDDQLPASEIRGMLRMRQAELEQQMQEDQERLARVAARLREIEQEDQMPAYDVVVKKVEPVTVAAVRDTIPTYSDVGRLYGELAAYLMQHGVNLAAAPCLAIYYDTEYRERDVDAEAAIGVDPSLPGTPRIEVRTLPGVESMACVVHQGSYDTIGEAYQAIMKWIEANGYRIVGPNREVYVQSMSQGVDPSAYVTEIQIPVMKA